MRTAAFLSLLASSLVGCGSSEPPYEGPYRHVILVSLDTMRADHVSSYDTRFASTPRLDQLARSGVRFADVTAAAPTTLASHTSLMTGSWPHTHGVVRNGFTVHPDNVMLPELLQEKGFHTAGFLGSFALESRFQFDQGFDLFDEEFNMLTDGNVDQNQRLAEDLTFAALKHIDRVKDEEERIFLFLQYFDPHAPYGPPASEGAPRTTMAQVEATVRAHQQRLIGSSPGHGSVINYGLPKDLIGKAIGTPLPEDKELVEAYAAEVAYLDRCLGVLFDGLDKAGILDEAIVIVTADHGETFYEHHDFWNHGLWLYQTTMEVPLIFKLPEGTGGIEASGLEVNVPVSGIDVLPTLCELLELEVPGRCEGRSLVPLLEGQQFDRGMLFGEATQPGPASKLERPNIWGNRGKPRMVRDGPYKLIESPYHGDLRQLFHLGDDPGETRDLLVHSPDDPAVQAQVRKMLRELRVWDSGAVPLPSSFDATQSAETQRRLEAMGYAGNDDD